MLGSQLIIVPLVDRVGPVGEVHGRRSIGGARHQVRVDLVGDERRVRGGYLSHRDEALPQGEESGLGIGILARTPEATTASPHVPVRQVVDESLDPLSSAA